MKIALVTLSLIVSMNAFAQTRADIQYPSITKFSDVVDLKSNDVQEYRIYSKGQQMQVGSVYIHCKGMGVPQLQQMQQCQRVDSEPCGIQYVELQPRESVAIDKIIFICR